jgi:uncharacterized protein YndB with AHSA1/START domain
MNHYRQTVLIEAPPEDVYAALTTQEGVRGWWTLDCDVPTAVGQTIRIRFGTTYKDLRIERLEPQREVQWACTAACLDVEQLARKDEWLGTRIFFRLRGSGKATQLELEHFGLVPQFECFDLCSAGWREFMASLKLFAETGMGRPFDGSSQPAPAASLPSTP